MEGPCTCMWKSSRIMNEASKKEISSCSKHRGLAYETVLCSVVCEEERKTGREVARRTVKFCVLLIYSRYRCKHFTPYQTTLPSSRLHI